MRRLEPEDPPKATAQFPEVADQSLDQKEDSGETDPKSCAIRGPIAEVWSTADSKLTVASWTLNRLSQPHESIRARLTPTCGEIMPMCKKRPRRPKANLKLVSHFLLGKERSKACTDCHQPNETYQCSILHWLALLSETCHKSQGLTMQKKISRTSETYSCNPR